MNKQRSDEWLAERIGMITASRIADMMATTKTGEAASRVNYRAELVAERMTGLKAESYTNAAMQHGTETEPYARMAYEALTGDFVIETGFVPHPSIKRSGASPDGLILDDGLAEIKCPNTATHIGYLLAGEVPTKYKPQMAWQLVCTGRKWCDFVSFDPRLNPLDQLFVVRYTPEESYLGELERAVETFDAEIEDMIKRIIAKRKI